jgi:hypothetical protein
MLSIRYFSFRSASRGSFSLSSPLLGEHESAARGVLRRARDQSSEAESCGIHFSGIHNRARESDRAATQDQGLFPDGSETDSRHCVGRLNGADICDA